MYTFLFLLLSLLAVDAGKILVYSPSISRSHLISNGRIADALVDAGHDVVMFITEYEPLTEFTGTKKAKVITMKGFSTKFAEDMDGIGEYLLSSSRLSFLERLMFEKTCTGACDDLMTRREELEQLRAYNFDVAFSEQIDLCGVGIVRYLGIKNHLWISTTPIMDAVSYNLGIPAPSSYVPTIEENDNGDKMDFWQRTFNLYMKIGSILIHRYGTDGTTEVFRKYIPDFPNVREIAANSSLCFVNSDEVLDLPRPTITKAIYVGGLGIPKVSKPLDKKFTNIMSKGKEGVVIISLGSIIPFGDLPAAAKEGVLRAIQEISDYHFLIKIAKGDNNTKKLVEGIKNVDVAEWLPQVDILSHPRLKLFVMHGGINGLVETAIQAVPTVIVPVFADQFRNGRMVEKRGIGKVLLKLDIGYESFKNTVLTVLNTPSYKKNAIRIGKMMRDKPFSPEERLTKWTQFAIDHGVLEELHVEGSRLNTIIYYNLDVIAFVLFVFVAVLHVFIYAFKFLCCKKRSQSNIKKSKKNN
ncbi:UDP-glucuronosyltransferase [Caenorhabditis elegans]|uniref:UDP-glucuronosyltransferase n=1 Tax=Caenorhabditis elegans TaxID=6239 RepID=Q17399_CAEEL|nr:UDP-glucuronosyltransferase [Caenorhabditis elegans]CAA94866.2 UDP-glucuronosyltransferase [Caenorhabditis elegans]|eukprot:NP_505666.2 UDP-glucuronosyltransferase [Caenorhabditis elegans]